MPFFRDLFDQARQVFLAMPMQSRVIAVLLVTAIAVSLAFLVKGGTTDETVYLFGDTVHTESELNAMDVAFGQAQLSGWRTEGRRVRVPASQRPQFLAALEDAASLPPGLRSNLEAMMDSAGPFDSDVMVRTKLMVGKQQDIARSLEQMHDIRFAVVTYTQGERRPFQAKRDESAAVMITPEGSLPLERGRVNTIREYVAKAFGLDVNDVNVTDVNSPDSSSLADEEDPWIRREREVEEATRRQIMKQLSYIEGVVVEVNAEIDSTLDTEQTRVQYDAQPTTVSEKTRKISQQSNRPLVGGVPGTEPNAIGNRARNLEDLAQTSTMSDDTKESDRVVGQTFEKSRTLGLLPTRVTATITLPTSYYDKYWLDQQMRDNPDTPAEELPKATTADLNVLRDTIEKEIQGLVTPMLPQVAAGEDARPLVTVVDMPDLRTPVVEEADTVGQALTWLADSWKSIALLLLGVFALFVARSAVSGGGKDTPAEFTEGFGLELPAPPPPEEKKPEDGEKMTITGGSLQDELVNLVESNPEVAANVIRGWVGEAA
ncbi:beta-cystathionase [Crateriforma conspicua]|nr:beta-cystathionase [Crateriforma conspicua]